MKFKKALLINIQGQDLEEAYWHKLRELCDKIVCVSKDTKNMMSELADTDCILVNFATQVTKEMIDGAPELKYIGVFANAFDEIDIKYASQRRIPVCNMQGILTESVAEFIIASILEFTRNLAEERKRGESGNYVYSEEGIENLYDLFGSNFGIVGLGHIGSRVGELAQAFGCNVNYWSKHQKDVPFTHRELDEVIRVSDFLSISTSLNEETKHILNADRISNLKSGAVVIIAAPMELVDVDALAARLQKGDITFISDHAELMSLEEVSKLTVYKNCIMYPPIAPVTRDVRHNKQEMLIQNIEAVLKGQPQNQVNK